MKGQFFMISTVIMISALVLITHYLYDYGKVDLTQIEQMQELNYIEDIENSLESVARISCDGGSSTLADYNVALTIDQLKNSFIEKGIVLNIISYGTNCGGGSIEFDMSMDSSEFHIEKEFTFYNLP